MEEKYSAKINPLFLRTLKQNLIDIFKDNTCLDVELSDFDGEELWINLGGTFGYEEAFTRTCESLECVDLRQYYAALVWDESDRFDSDVLDLAIKYGVVTPMQIEPEANESGVSLDGQKEE